MDDLAGLDWNASGAKKGQAPSAPPGSNYFPSLRPQTVTPLSGRSTPSSSVPGSGLPSKPATPLQGASVNPTSAAAAAAAKDSFANLFTSSSTTSANKNLSLAEQQRRLQLQQQQRLQQGNGSIGSVGNGVGEDAWAKLGGTGGGPRAQPAVTLRPDSSGPRVPSPQVSGSRIQAPAAAGTARSVGKSTGSEDDILAAFRADAPVDRSSHFPAPTSANGSARGTPIQVTSSSGGGLLGADDDDDDPFGLGTSTAQTGYRAPQATVATGAEDDIDILGDLGKPVSELPPRRAPRPPPAPEAEAVEDTSKAIPGDKSVAELVDMGFPAESARLALDATNGNVQAAVSWLLTQAHEESRSKSQTPANGEHRPRRRQEEEHRSSSAQRQAMQDKDATQRASELGNSLWKGANALWKSGKKQLDKAVADFNTDQEASQPKWMRDASNSRSSSAVRREPKAAASELTDEAMMLDSHDARPSQAARRQEAGGSTGSSAAASRDRSPALPVRPASRPESPGRPAWQQQQQAPQARSKLSRQMVEEQEAQAYVSPARRKKTTPKSSAPEPDLLQGGSVPVPPPRAMSSSPAAAKPAPIKSAPIAVRPAAKTRPIPAVSAIALKSSTQHRAAGTAAFKRGDYASADTSYSSAVTALPTAHPIVILLLTNRATTRIKTGDTKGALADAEQAIRLIGPARGAGESIDVPDEDGNGKTASKDMGPFWGKAIMKRAEALEHMERWADAAAAWRDAVEGGVGGSNAIQGRNRCENAVKPKPAPKPAVSRPAAAAAAAAAAKPRPAPRPAATRNPESAQAVNRLREANKEAERVDEEKFRLADSVDGRIDSWRKGKETNLRALLGSLDTVLWADSGWKKVNMSELIVPGKVKIAYMKGIAKVHPDKLPTTATTEQIMISGAVFSTLNEAWDKFKAENGL